MSAQEAFSGGVAVITGAGAGIGEGLAREAARIGMTVVVSDVNAERAERVAGDIRGQGGRAEAEAVDVRDAAAMQALADRLYERHGAIRLLINNAGIELLGLSWELTPEQWQLAMDINVNGVFHGVQAFAGRMIEQARGGSPAAIANLSSIGGFTAGPGMAAYLVTKNAVLCYTECLFQEMELIGAPVDVSVIIPGMVRTRIFEDAPVSQGSDRELADTYRRFMRDMMAQNGMDLALASTAIFDQLAAREFWISTQPEMTEASAARRAAIFTERKRPSVAPEMRERLGY